MRYLIVIFLCILAGQTSSEDEVLLNEVVAIAIKENNIKSESEKEATHCALGLVFKKLTDKEKGFMQLMVEQMRAFPELSDEQVADQVNAMYDSSGSITEIIQSKIDALEKEINVCYTKNEHNQAINGAQ